MEDRAKRLVVANLKGGAGKTTTTVHLAEVIARRTSGCTVVDLDPNADGSATAWYELAGDRMRATLASEAAPCGWTVFDTPPWSASVVKLAVESADAVLIPVRPSGLDLSRLASMTEVVARAGKPPVVLVNAAVAGTNAQRATMEALEESDLPVLRTWIPQRQSIQNAYGTAPTKGALRLYDWLFDELEEALS